MSLRIGVFCLAVQGLFIFFAASAFAEFRLTPGLYVREEYNDNIFLDSENEESDFITTIGPTLSLLWETKFIDLSLDYGLHFRKYINNPEEDETDLDQTQRVVLETTFNLYRDALFLRVSDVFQRVAIDEEGRGGLDNINANMTNQNVLTVNPYLQLQPWRTVGFRFDYIYTNIWNDEDEAIDYQQHTISGRIDKELTARITTYAVLKHSRYLPDEAEREEVDTLDEEFESEEHDRNSITVGANYLIGRRLTLGGFIGRTWIEYKEDERSLNDETTNLWGANADYQLTNEVSFGGGYSQTDDFSISEGAVETERYTAYVAYQKRLSVSLNGFVSENRFLAQERTDDVWGLTLGGDWPWTNKMGIDYLAAYTDFTQDDIAEIDDEYVRYSTRLGWYRDLSLGRFRLGYTYNQNDADSGIDEYTNNIVWAEMRFIF